MQLINWNICNINSLIYHKSNKREQAIQQRKQKNYKV